MRSLEEGRARVCVRARGACLRACVLVRARVLTCGTLSAPTRKDVCVTSTESICEHAPLALALRPLAVISIGFGLSAGGSAGSQRIRGVRFSAGMRVAARACLRALRSTWPSWALVAAAPTRRRQSC